MLTYSLAASYKDSAGTKKINKPSHEITIERHNIKLLEIKFKSVGGRKVERNYNNCIVNHEKYSKCITQCYGFMK
jgi:hypothetical protein